ncbi:EAL domain-containing protein [Planctomycetes bacterium K23_9]|uniref:Cyclic-di-GMP phosphodiesterase AdrB n=1 Tax=Stieleria marina TaxID=1930275 RepID=A0A517NXD5_9BACT|nr:Putative cyclic-di-GMP phosphodiesterase AdrB [Planctomycetes bacterium K23_9]
MQISDNASPANLDSLNTDKDVWFLSGATEPDDTIRHLPIDNCPFVVGRNHGSALKLRFKTVSGQHAAMSVEDGYLFLTDLNSTNGTYVNGTRITGRVAINEEDLIHFAEAPFRVRRQSPTGHVTGTIEKSVCDEALALVQFDRLMSERLVRPHFQPIVKTIDAQSIGFEILGRGSVFGLESVGAMFHAAEQLNLEVELSRMLRWEGIRVGRDLPDSPMLFVNTHPKEMEDCKGLIESLTNVKAISGNVQLVLEIHEAAVTDRHNMRELASALKELDIRLAFDDFGSGQARLAELIESKPDYVKFDISLIRGIDSADEQRRRMISTLVQMVRDLGVFALAEGVETVEEAETCKEIGFDLAQGYFFGRPSPAQFSL